jgi:hypothetical protein
MRGSKFQIDLKNKSRKIINKNESLDYGRCNTYPYRSCTKFVTSKKYWNYLCRNFKFIMEPIRSVPLYSMAMP